MKEKKLDMILSEVETQKDSNSIVGRLLTEQESELVSGGDGVGYCQGDSYNQSGGGQYTQNGGSYTQDGGEPYNMSCEEL